MVNRRRDQRRRRVVLDEIAGNSQPAEALADDLNPSSEKNSLYAQSALRRHHAKTSDLFPKRLRAFVWTVLAMSGAIGCLNGIDRLSRYLEPFVAPESLRPLQVGQVGSLASWYATFLLIIAALTSIQIYSLRQHRNDDYRGRYRMWVWMAGLLMVASAMTVVDGWTLAGAILRGATRWPEPQIFWTVFSVQSVLLAALALRAFFEMRASRGATIMLAVSSVCYAAVLAMTIPAVRERLTYPPALIEGNLVVGAHSLALLTLAVYLRYVFFEAHGLLASRAAGAKTAARPDVAEEAESAGWSQRWGQWRTARAEARSRKAAEKESRREAKRKERAERKAAAKAARAAAAEAKKSNETQSPAPSETNPKKSSVVQEKSTSGPLSSRIKSRSCEPDDRNPSGRTAEVSDDKSSNGDSGSAGLSPDELEQLENEILALSDKPNLSKSDRRRLKKLQKRYERAA